MIVYRLPDLEEIARADLGATTAIGLAADGQELFFGRAGRVQRWNIAAGETSPVTARSTVNYGELTLSPDGRLLAATDDRAAQTQVWELFPYAEADRQAVEILSRYARVEAIVAGERITIPWLSALPTRPPALTAIHLGDRPLPRGFAKEILLPAMESLESLEEISDPQGRLAGAGTNLAELVQALAELPAAPRLKTVELAVPLTGATAAALAKLPRLVTLDLSNAGDAELPLLSDHPNLRDIMLHGFGAAAKLTEQGQATLAALPIERLRFAGKCPGLNRRLWELLAASPTLSTLDLSAVALSPAQLAALPAELTALKESSTLKSLGLPDALSPEKAAELTAALPACRVALLGEVRFRLQSPAAGETLDLLPLIDPKVHSRNGQWETKDGVLVSPSGMHMSLELPVKPTGTYRLEATAERIEGNDDLKFGLLVGEGEVRLVLEAYKMMLSGIDLVAGKSVPDQSNKYVKPVFQSGSATNIVVEVTPGSVSATCNGKLVVDWQGDPRDLSFPSKEKDYRITNRCLFLASYESRFRITKLTYTPLADPTEKPPPQPAPPAEAAPKENP